MVPRADIVAIALDRTLREVLDLFRTAGHSRLPVYDETLDDPRGMIHIRDLLVYLASEPRFGLVAGDPAYSEIEQRLACQPVINEPAITFDGEDDGVRSPSRAGGKGPGFAGPRSHRVVPGVGHNMPQEVPEVFAQAVLELVGSQTL